MKVCVTSSGPDLNSLVDLRFGRCLYFIFVDSEDEDKIDVVPNKGIEAARGAGIQSAQTVIDQGAEAVISGNMGPNSFMVLTSSRIKIFQTLPGLTVKEAIEAFRNNNLPEITQPVGPGFGAKFGRGGHGGRGKGFGLRRRGR
ncbi:MAG TPA: dinitrogenase iron-molybdenum cofactor biosynthesis protein [Candidatus Parcubacteria bacterium]|nr:dinitrogenase iron-molybdenum cofactor biosynthesis protein [Candidatus Parcubacteria bacterium]